MGGIFGIFHADDRPVDESELCAMAHALEHRGPDGVHQQCKGSIGLGSCLLHSTPESLSEVLPRWDEDSGLAITADARIDNREQLLSDLSLQRRDPLKISDSSLILQAYIQWGETCVDHLIGDFVFAIWDASQSKLFCARDHFGCKPFYYHAENGIFVFASSATAVARVKAVQASLNESRVADYLVDILEGGDHTSTFYNEVSRLPPAHALSYDIAGLRSSCYWSLQPAEELQLDSDEAYLDRFSEIFSEAVRCRMRSQSDPAAMLSGGLDSSTIVALARNICSEEGRPYLRTFSGISEGDEPCPETESSHAVAHSGFINPVFLKPDDVMSHQAVLNAALDKCEDPFDLDMTLPSLICGLAAAEGRRVVLAGLDGEHVAGLHPDYYIRLFRQGDWRIAWQECKGLSGHYYRGSYSAVKLFWKAVRARLIPQSLRKLKKTLRAFSGGQNIPEMASISPEFAHRIHWRDRLETCVERSRVAPDADLDEVYRHYMSVAYLTAGVERYERVASYHGVEVRQPLLDKRLVEFFAALPWRFKMRDGWSKYLLRRLAAQHLPDSVAWREGSESIGANFNTPLMHGVTDKTAQVDHAMVKMFSSWMPQGRIEDYFRAGVVAGDQRSHYEYYRMLRLYLWRKGQ